MANSLTPGSIIKTVFFSLLVFGFFFIMWIYNPFMEQEKLPLPSKYRDMIYSDDPNVIAAGRQIVSTTCAACHSLRYDGIYPLSVTSLPDFPKILKEFGKPISNDPDSPLYKLHADTKGFSLVIPEDTYEAAFYSQLNQLKQTYGKVPPDLSEMYNSRGPEYLWNWVQNPNKLLPGTAMPAILQGHPKEAAEVVAYLRAVDKPSPAEQTKRFEMGVFTIAFLISFGVVILIYRKRLVDKMGLH